jgi:hypothetical protein
MVLKQNDVYCRLNLVVVLGDGEGRSGEGEGGKWYSCKGRVRICYLNINGYRT